MSTLSVPLTPELEGVIHSMVKNGFAPNKAEVVRKAVRLLAEDQAVMAVLQGEQEIREKKVLSGDARSVYKKFK